MIRISILFGFLLVCSVFDWKNRAIPAWLCYSGVLLMAVVSLWIKDMTAAECIGGALLGAVLLVIGKLTGGQLGEGDGIVFIATGIGLGTVDNCLLLMGALLISFFWSLLLMAAKKITLKTKLPFLPFVFAAFVLEFIVQI